MLYSDWLKNFEQVQICNLSPDSFEGQLTAQQVWGNQIHSDCNFLCKKGKHITWHQTQFDGAWIKGQTAGGCGQPKIG